MKMKVFLSVLLFGSNLLMSLVTGQDDEKYSSRYDNIDINNIFRSRLLNHYVDCLLDKKPCPPEGKDLKQVLPDALKTSCSRCTKLQKEKALDVITRLYYQHPSLYTALAERYDPTGEYTKNFENWFDQQNALKGSPQKNQSTRKEGNQFVTRSDVQVTRRSSDVQGTFNELQTEKTRIPSTWITTTVKTTTTLRSTTTRAPLRTLPPEVNPAILPQVVLRETSQTIRTSPVQSTLSRTTESVQTGPVIQRYPTTLRSQNLPQTEPPRKILLDQQSILRASSAERSRNIIAEVQTPPSINAFDTVKANLPTDQKTSVLNNVESKATSIQKFPIQSPETRTEQIKPQSPPVALPPFDLQSLRPKETSLNSRESQSSKTLQDQEKVDQPIDSNFKPLSLIDNFFIPNGNQQFRRSIEGLWDTTGKVVNNVAEMFRSTVEVITGTK